MQNETLLNNTLEYALKNVSYYRTHINNIGKYLCSNVYEKFPVLHKEMVLKDPSLFLSDEYKFDLNARKLIRRFTSGSTGDCLEVYWSRMGDALSNLTAWKYRQQWYPVDIQSKFLSFHTNNGEQFSGIPEKIYYNKNSVNMSIFRLCLNEKNIDWISEKIQEFEPVWILSYPSILYILTNLMKRKGCAWFFNSIKYIEVMGESLQDSLLDYFKLHYPNAKIADMYGITEVGTIALQCPEGHRHIITKNVFVEISQEEKVLVTSLKNMAMPLIRYDTGDIAKWKNIDCSCGCDAPIIELTPGRVTHNIILPSGSVVHAHLILYIIKKINSEFGFPIIQFKAIQRSLEVIDVYVILKKCYENWVGALEQTFNVIANDMVKENIYWRILPLKFENMDLMKKNEFFKSEMELKSNELLWSLDGLSL